MLAPALLVIAGLFAGGLIEALAQSLGWFPALGMHELTLANYREVLSDPSFVNALLLTCYIAGSATLLSTVLAVGIALLFRRRVPRWLNAVFQLPITVPYLVAAIGIAMLVSQTGLIARVAAALGLVGAPRDFPPLVHDRFSLGIILTYVWKETPFIALVVLASLSGLTEELEQAARTLGANRRQCFRFVTLPRIAPAVVVASVTVFAFSFGAFETPYLLGRTYPQTLPVLAWNAYRSVDLAERPLAMAIAIVIACVTGVLALVYLKLARRLSDA
jgi:putative spermidine/putrescine transport system permease protein